MPANLAPVLAVLVLRAALPAAGDVVPLEPLPLDLPAGAPAEIPAELPGGLHEGNLVAAVAPCPAWPAVAARAAFECLFAGAPAAGDAGRWSAVVP